MNKKLYIIFTVDWEKDHGKWKFNSKDVDYGGILTGTKCLEDILDDIGIPCTWFVETHKDYHKFDIPNLFPESISELRSRKKDEIGTHIHWISNNHKKNYWEYPIHDTDWVNSLIRYAKDEAESFKINPISFRGGAFIHVPNLPLILQSNGYMIDSTFEWAPSTRIHLPKIEYISKLMSTPPLPYFSDLIDIRKRGSSNILEFPVYLWVPRILKNKFVTSLFLQKLKYMMHGFVTFYLHIDEITDHTTGPNEKTKINKSVIDSLRYFLEDLASNENVEFLTFNAGYEYFKKIE